MTELIIEHTATAAWHRAVSEAAERAEHPLDEERESYLVFLLMRYLDRAELVRSILAMRFLEALTQPRRQRAAALLEVGDQCLLYAGLFPEQARRRRVSPRYFVDLGRSAYAEVAEGGARAWAPLFESLAETFLRLTDVLAALRRLDNEPLLDALSAMERSLHSGEAFARSQLRRHTAAVPVADVHGRRH